MTSPTDDRMPGVTDFEVTLPFIRYAGNEGDTPETTALRVRVPASTNAAACKLGETIAEHVGAANRTDDGPGWSPLLAAISAIDIENVPDPAQLTAQLMHWQKIVAVIAEKYPTMVQISAEEYASADPSQLVPMQAGDDTVMYATRGTLEPIVTGTALGTFLLPAPAGVVGPAGPDVGVRGMKVQNLPVLPLNKIDLLHEGQWMPIVGVNIGADLSVTVTVTPAHEDGYKQWRFNDLEHVVAIRPAAVLSQGSDLPSASVHGRQMLIADGWWTVALAEFTGQISQSYNTTLVKDPQHRTALNGVVLTGDEEARHTSVGATDPVLLRDEPPKWWS